MEKPEPSSTDGRNVNGAVAGENSSAVLQNAKHSYHMTLQFHS